MKKILTITIFLIILSISIKVQATNENIIESQSNELNINNFINQTESLVGQDIDLEDIFNESIQGKSSKNTIINTIGIVLGKELKQSLSMIISILLVIIIHGILRSVTENLGNEQTGKIGYFIQIIMLITILMKIYTEILNIVKESIETISSFVYMLIPVFISLTISTRKCNNSYCYTICNTSRNEYNYKIYKSISNTNSNNCNSHWDNIKHFRRNTYEQISKIYEI